jgi:uncharacterized membrane protein YccC
MSNRLASLPRLVLAEFFELTLTGPRARLAVAAAFAVGAAILLALMLRLQDVYWAGISAFVCIQASQPQSVRKGLHRILGTVVGAALALLLFPLVAFNHAATMLLLFCAGSLAILGSLVSRYSYAWLLGGITTLMVVLGALDDPLQTLNLAFYRSSEIILGTCVALATAKTVLPPGTSIAPAAPGWASLLDTNWYMLGHAVRTGIAVALVPVIWRIFELPALSQMAISIGAVMAVPVLTGNAEEDRRAVVERSAQRLLGCLVGGGIGLLVLITPLASLFWTWLLLLMVGAAIGVEMQTGRHGVQTIGIQAEIAFILTMTQGWGPAVSLLPAIDRVAGMMGAIALLLAVNFFFGPEKDIEIGYKFATRTLDDMTKS